MFYDIFDVKCVNINSKQRGDISPLQKKQFSTFDILMAGNEPLPLAWLLRHGYCGIYFPNSISIGNGRNEYDFFHIFFI